MTKHSEVELCENKEFEQNIIEQKPVKAVSAQSQYLKETNGMSDRMVLLPAGRISQSFRAEVKERRHSLWVWGAILDDPALQI